MKETGYTSMNRIFSKLSRDTGIDDFSESDVIEWTGEALEAIDCVTMLEESVEFCEVKNHQVVLPKFLDSIIQVARNNEWTSENPEICNPGVIAEAITSCPPGDVDCICSDARYIPVDETNTPIFTSDLYEYRPNINVLAEYINWTKSEYYKTKWSAIRLKNHSFFNSVVCKEDNADGLYNNSDDEYTLIGNKIMRFSFETGFVAIAFTRQMLDSQGYPMVPDHFAYTTAVTKYATLKLMERALYAGRQGAAGLVVKLEKDWKWYCKQAGNRGIMPKGLDQFENMLEQRQYLLPRIHRYHQFFKDMSRLENRAYNDPDSRNQHNNRYGSRQ